MSISIYYTAFRDTPLTPEEGDQIKAIEERYSVDDRIEEYLQTGVGENWESFTVYSTDDLTEPGVIFEGAAEPDAKRTRIRAKADSNSRENGQ